MAVRYSERRRGLGTRDFIATLPDWPLVRRFRLAWYRRNLRACGIGLDVATGVYFEFPSRITVGDNVFLNRGVIVTARAPITIGDDVLVGPYTIINSGDHLYNDTTVAINTQGHRSDTINIGNDVWIGAHACILRGVTVGDGAVVGAGAVVISNVEPFVVVGGVPAKVIGKRDGDHIQ
jgi:acetyltransferase-like isoleucine patch superfamily enzyme